MPKKKKNIQELAIEYLEYLELRVDETGKHWFITNNAEQKFKDMINEIHGSSIRDEWTMQFIYDSLSALAETDDGFRPFVEPDVYTNQLTNWLHSNDNRLSYLTQVLQKDVVRDGFQALQKAQYAEKCSVLDRVKEIIISGK